MSISEIKRKARTQLHANFGTLLLIMVLEKLIFAIPVLGFIIWPAVDLSCCVAFRNVAEGRRADINDMFSRINQAGRAWWVHFLVSLFISLWSLLLVIPGIIKRLSYGLFGYVMADHPEMTARQAIKESMRIMEGHKLEAFTLHLSFIGWNILGVLTGGLSLLYSIPYHALTCANYYNSIKPKTEAPESEWSEWNDAYQTVYDY